MRRLIHTLFAGMLLLAGSALAADQLEASRAAVAQARLRLQAAKAQQAQLEGQLDALGARIQELKSRGRGRLLPGGELDTSLKRSQELSGALTGLATDLEHASGELEQANLALLSALSGELSRLHGEWERSGREQRVELLSRMRRLRAEREGLRGALPAAQVPALLPSPTSDDPTDLLEQADALRDVGDKVKKRLQAVDARIVEVREERELDRRMGEFVEEGQLLDEPDRRLRMDLNLRSTDTASSPAVRGGSMDMPSGGPKGPALPSRPPATEGGGSLREGSGDDLKSLEAERVQLQGLEKELEAKAAQAEARARSLK